MLWPSSIALAHELVARADSLAGVRILELGAGTGLPGIVAATYGARVLQTDRLDVALDLCRRNAERNHVRIEHRVADWTIWSDEERYDLILGADVLYAERLHSFLRHIFETNLAPNRRHCHGRPIPCSPVHAAARVARGRRMRRSVSPGGPSARAKRSPGGGRDVTSNSRATP